ncbi:FMN-binding negative transcriptional regulator [Massilia arenosa]|uniref:FMN-binding negative transcriptional regulator n=1 Tax=Zemynaea arenosa TaxID=2561931 RepID=A0A4Y9SCR3_9BURK|nr:FMN-binding negative transcriptional regulator [Massilia arenosa]TFW17585.1 FMN-binding negative transcriptional regulator [Massilia arenosa]
MYKPAFTPHDSVPDMHALIEAHPLGAVVIQTEDGLTADHVPFLILPPSEGAPFGTLRAHVARANPLWQRTGGRVLVIFRGHDGYVTPALYDEKTKSGKVVPTWNYAVVHAHGTLRAVDDPQAVLTTVDALTRRHEAGRAQPWQVRDTPQEYLDKLLSAIVGIEIDIARMEGKWKASRNRTGAEFERISAAVPVPFG